MSDHLDSLKLFIRVARKGSFSAAARELEIPQSTASRTIAELERKIGASLLARSTRAVTLTEAGVNFLARLEPALAELEDAEAAVRGSGELNGVLRVGVATSIAIRQVIPLLPEFMRCHPALRIDLLMEDQRQNLLRDGVDVVLRFGVLGNSDAIAKRIATNRRVLAASPTYLERAGTPETPADLALHRVIIGPTGATLEGWKFTRDGRTVSVRVEGRLHATVNEGAVVAAVAGLGIVSTGMWGCRAELASGALVQLLTEWQMGSSDLHALMPAGRLAKASARAFTDFLMNALAD